MPPKNTTCNNGKIYKLVSNADDQIYIGSTTYPLHNRFYHHKVAAKTATTNMYTHFNKIGWDNVRIELIENYPCSNRDQLRMREKHWVLLNIQKVVNTNIPYDEKERFCPICNKYYQLWYYQHHTTTRYHQKNILKSKENYKHNEQLVAENVIVTRNDNVITTTRNNNCKYCDTPISDDVYTICKECSKVKQRTCCKCTKVLVGTMSTYFRHKCKQIYTALFFD